MTTSGKANAKPLSGNVTYAGAALGFGLGGFFDGILLHQVFQWHHLLSGLEDARLDIRTLILTDGLFHVLMYVITCWGLWMLWRARREVDWRSSNRRMAAFAVAGFGTWHIVDGILSHWILGIHRVRMDVDNPLFWDLAWFAVFGVLPLLLAVYWLKVRPSTHNRVLSSPLALVLAVCVAGPSALIPPPQSNTVMVMFQPGMSTARAMDAIDSVEGTILWTDHTQQVWAIRLDEPPRSLELYRRGALIVGNSILPTGCFGWTKAG